VLQLGISAKENKMRIHTKVFPEIVNSGELQSRGIGEHNSISNGPDNGANNCNAVHFWNSMRHNTIEEAVTNFLNRLETQSGNLNISGHGNSGILECGSGQSGGYNELTDIFSWNPYAWSPFFEKLEDKGFGILSIYSCHTGADEDGANLLFLMATIMNRPVRARTGFTACGSQSGISFPDGTWQVAYPGQKPTPIPKARLHMEEEPFSLLTVTIPEEDLAISVNAVICMKSFTKDGREISMFDGIGAQYMVRSLFSAPAINIGGDPLSLVTGRIDLTFRTEQGERVLSYDVHNDIAIFSKNNKVMRYVPQSLLGALRVR
jgi:hypothetical protein